MDISTLAGKIQLCYSTTELAQVETDLTMTSREIADLTGVRHDNVKRTIDGLIEKGILSPRKPVAITSNDVIGRIRSAEVYEFSGDSGIVESYAVIAKLSPKHLLAAIKFWEKSSDTLDKLLEAFKSFDVPDEFSNMYVYAIREVDSGNIKIGISKDPAKRRKQLQTANSSKLELVAYILAQDRFKLEAKLHKDNSHLAVRGEWFKPEAVNSLTS